ncbi:MAG TPA: hypothetical protein V6D05_08115, partial [Stenomitos sp.]
MWGHARRAWPLLPLILAASCALEDDPVPAPRPVPKATASAPASSTTLHSGIDTQTGPVSLETLAPVLHPTTQPTPFGTLGLPYLV